MLLEAECAATASGLGLMLMTNCEMHSLMQQNFNATAHQVKDKCTDPAMEHTIP